MYRPALLVITALALTLPAGARAQTSTERTRQSAERAEERERQRDERDRKRDEDRRARDSAGSLDTVVAFDARGVVSVSCPGGLVSVTGSDRNEIRIHARTESGAIRFSANGSRATLEPAASRGGCSEGKFEITVPAGARVSATTWSGEARVRAVHGDVDVHSQSGDVDVRDVERLEIESLSGDVTVTGAKGDVSVRTVSGELHLSGARGAVVLETISGDLTLSDIISRSVRAHASSGAITFQGAIVDGGRYEFDAHSGEIGLQLPPDMGAELSLSTFNGGIESDFPITLKAGEHGIGALHAKRLTFTVGKGSARIIAETFSGDITLKRHR